jgi:hypothetical protein
MESDRIGGALRRAILFASLLALVLPGLASAQHPGRGGRGGQQPQQGASRPMMPPSQGQRDAGFRNARQGPPPPQRGRMSEEERQQLRRDISDHGRDIYRDRSAQSR